MVLVQDDDASTEHVIYYLSRNLLDTETRYACQEVGIGSYLHHPMILALYPVAHNARDL